MFRWMLYRHGHVPELPSYTGSLVFLDWFFFSYTCLMVGYVGLPPLCAWNEVKFSTYHFPSSLSLPLSVPLSLRTEPPDFFLLFCTRFQGCSRLLKSFVWYWESACFLPGAFCECISLLGKAVRPFHLQRHRCADLPQPPAHLCCKYRVPVSLVPARDRCLNGGTG